MIPKSKIVHGSHIIVKLISKLKNMWVKDFINEINFKKCLISNTVYGRRHSKLFTNSQVSWDTLYRRTNPWFLISELVSEQSPNTGLFLKDKTSATTLRDFFQFSPPSLVVCNAIKVRIMWLKQNYREYNLAILSFSQSRVIIISRLC